MLWLAFCNQSQLPLGIKRYTGQEIQAIVELVLFLNTVMIYIPLQTVDALNVGDTPGQSSPCILHWTTIL